MESNGKSVARNGEQVTYPTGPVIWGEQEQMVSTRSTTNSPGNEDLPCDFLAPVLSHHPISDHHDKLLSNFSLKTEAFDERENVRGSHQELTDPDG